MVKLACELPEKSDRALSLWDCAELARQLVADGIVESICPETIRRILGHHRLKPWRVHMWLSPKVPRDAAFRNRVEQIVTLYTRPLADHEAVICVDEKTSLQPRPRTAPTMPARPGEPARLECEYKRKGALNLIAAFDTRTGRVYAMTAERKRQVEFIAFLEQLDRELPPEKTLVHLVADNLRVHKSKQVLKWLAAHPRFQMHFTPVHCSWMNQIEQWFAILQRKALRIANFQSKEALASRLMDYAKEWNTHAHPFNWTTKSVAKVMARSLEETREAA